MTTATIDFQSLDSIDENIELGIRRVTGNLRCDAFIAQWNRVELRAAIRTAGCTSKGAAVVWLQEQARTITNPGYCFVCGTFRPFSDGLCCTTCGKVRGAMV